MFLGSHPFYPSDISEKEADKIYVERLRNAEPCIGEVMPKEARSPGRQMLHKIPKKRATFTRIQSHKYFQDISWSRLSERSLPSPLEVANVIELDNFPFASDVDLPLTLEKFTGDNSVFSEYRYDTPIPKEVHLDKIKEMKQKQMKEIDRLDKRHQREKLDLHNLIENEKLDLQAKIDKAKREMQEMVAKFEAMMQEKNQEQHQERMELQRYQQLDAQQQIETAMPEMDQNMDQAAGEPLEVDSKSSTSGKQFKKSHKDKYKYRCTICGAKLKSKRALKHHMRSKHQQLKRYHCTHCGKGFYHQNGHKYHMSKKFCQKNS